MALYIDLIPKLNSSTLKIAEGPQPFAYLKIPDRIVYDLFQKFKERTQNAALELPPYFQPSSLIPEPVGAHITFVKKLDFTEERAPILSNFSGSSFPIECIGIEEIVPKYWKAMKKVWICTIKSRALTRIGITIGLPLPKGESYHFTFAVERGEGFYLPPQMPCTEKPPQNSDKSDRGLFTITSFPDEQVYFKISEKWLFQAYQSVKANSEQQGILPSPHFAANIWSHNPKLGYNIVINSATFAALEEKKEILRDFDGAILPFEGSIVLEHARPKWQGNLMRWNHKISSPALRQIYNMVGHKPNRHAFKHAVATWKKNVPYPMLDPYVKDTSEADHIIASQTEDEALVSLKDFTAQPFNVDNLRLAHLFGYSRVVELIYHKFGYDRIDFGRHIHFFIGTKWVYSLRNKSVPSKITSGIISGCLKCTKTEAEALTVLKEVEPDQIKPDHFKLAFDRDYSKLLAILVREKGLSLYAGIENEVDIYEGDKLILSLKS